MQTTTTTYTFLIRQHLEDGFWKSEIDSTLKLVGHEEGISDCFLERFPLIDLNIKVTREQAVQAGERSVMVKKILEVYSQGNTIQDIKIGFEKITFKPFPSPSWIGKKDTSFPIEDFIDSIKELGVKEKKKDGNNDDPVILHLCHFNQSWYGYATKVIGTGSLDLVNKYNLKEREYLGPTTLTSELAFIMANLALARKGSYIMDPFFGTGGALIGCAQFGSTLFGIEIDWRVVNGGQQFKTYDQYGLARPDIIRGDFSSEGRCLREHDVCKELFDAIIADPPYGIRAGARKTGHIEEHREILPEQRATHIPQTQKYEGEDVIRDLLNGAANILKPGGRLVYLYPVQTENWNKQKEEILPRHPKLMLLFGAHQGMRCGMSRILITMEKKVGNLSEEAVNTKKKVKVEKE